jgi:hypothetical protein
MRYLNKIVFINSASVKYAEIGLDGNVHLIGTQGVGKSTLLRAILFFYNANKSKLGIPKKGKKKFDDYYFEYQNSYIVYEVVKDNIPFCVLAYKVNGKVAFRFINSEYKRDFFIDRNGKAQDWENIRKSLGTDVYYTKIISSYEEYKKIIYGDNKGLKSEFRKYALIESKQYQNIPRTIQNVLLNSNLEAKFIKDTIINSISEDEFKIDVSNYSKNHLRDFETQINDIKIWFKKNKKGQIVIRNQAGTIIDNYRNYNYLNREKKELAINLSSRLNYIEIEKPNLLNKFSTEKITLEKLQKKVENIKKLHLKREQDIVSEIKYISKKLTESKQKITAYENQNIKSVIEKVAKKEALISEEKTKNAEKTLLTSKFSEISQKFDAMIQQTQNQQNEFENGKNAEINKVKSKFGNEKLALFESYKNLIEKIKNTNQEQKEKAENELKLLIDNENNIKRNKAELKHKVYFDIEIKNFQDEKTQLNNTVSKSKTIISNAKNETNTIRKEWELENKELERNVEVKIDKETTKSQSYLNEISVIQNNLKQSKSSLYGWLNDTVPNWENTIGKVIDDKNVLFNTNLNPKQILKNDSSFFGIEINLNAIDKRIKTVEEYNQEIIELENKITDVKSTITTIIESKTKNLNNLKIKFRKKLSVLNDTISENEYILTQTEQSFKNNKIALEEWETKAVYEKEKALQEFEIELENLSNLKGKAQNNLDIIVKSINREVTKKEKERESEISKIGSLKDETILKIEENISKNKTDSEKRLQEIKSLQNKELSSKGADTKRLDLIDNRLSEISNALNFIKDNEVLVIEFQKDKRELFDKIPQFKVDKSTLEKKQSTLIDEQKTEKSKFDTKCYNQKEVVQNIKDKIDEFERDVEKFNDFKLSESFSSIQDYFTTEIQEENHSKTAVLIIEELNDKHYGSVNTFKDLQQSTNSFIGNFNEHNIFHFKVSLNDDNDYLNFAMELKEFIEEDKINEFEKRVNERFAHIIQQIGNETTDLVSKEAEIEKIIKKINEDFTNKNFVDAIKEMEMRTQKSSNPVVKLLIQIKEFNDENSLLLGENNLFTSSDSGHKNNKAVELLKQLVKELEKYKNSYLTLSESFDLQFRIVENDNDSGWVEKLSNVGSEGTDVLVKAMINILLLNVFKNSASKKFKDFKLHCMMDEIGRLHPNNVKGILRFANERNILLINGSPTSQNATDYKYTYKLSKEQSRTDTKKYITKITQLVKITAKTI